MNYTGEQIEVLEGLEAVRKRPGMYIGSVDDDGLHQLIWELIDNAVDEFTSGHATKIDIVIEGSSIKVVDNGRGIPVDHNRKYDKNTLEILLTVLHSGGKFNTQNYEFSSGLHGVGLSVVNALASMLAVSVKRDGKLVRQVYNFGKPVTGLENIDEITELAGDKTGTVVQFTPDAGIITGKISKERILNKLWQLSCLNENIVFNFWYEGEHIQFKDNNILKFFTEDYLFNDHIEFTISSKSTRLRFAFNYSNSKELNNFFVNNIHTFNGGTHVNLVRNAIVRFFDDLIRKNFPKENIETVDIKSKMHLVVVLQMNEPMFAGQTKERLSSSLTDLNYNTLIQECLFNYFLASPFLAKQYLEVFRNNKKERVKIDSVKEKSKLDIVDAVSLCGNYQECSTDVFDEKELFIVEGESAGGTAKQARNRSNQSILSMRGKFLNAGKHQLSKLLKSNEITNLCSVLGVQLNTEDTVRLRYNRVIIMTDADHDGAHIVNLHMVLFFTYLKPLIHEGHLYLAVPPLYCIRNKLHILNYCYTEGEMLEYKNFYAHNKQKIFIQRFKGLGEMNPDQIKLTTMAPATRKLVKIKIVDLEKAEKIVNLVMGYDASFRRSLAMADGDEVNFEDMFETALQE